MAKSCQVNICISKDSIPHDTLIKLMQKMHIEAVKAVLENSGLTDSQLCQLSMELQGAGKDEK
ncbi:MAG: hypothetical protein HFH66_16690 [Lachnospiraceae bacterium]|jgi:beta-lactam-binding protein with PASTA domain|nr:hypothetical protein [Lachnospiraceae bacterium]